MTVRDVITTLLRSEVDDVDRGTDHLLAMEERQRERVGETERLRAQANARHGTLAYAVARRLKVRKT